MGNLFPRWTNLLPVKIAVCLGVLGFAVIGLAWYSWTPKATRVGYMPQQPIPFDHSLHAGQLGMDCRYCHNHVENSAHSNIPTAEACWTCHGPGKVKSDSPKLELLRQAMDPNDENYTGEPIRWVQIHETPDYAYFNHSVHVNRGVSCAECHGRIDEMPVVKHEKPLSMSFCLDCHRNPEEHLRPLDEITNLAWKAEDTDAADFYRKIAEKSGEEGGGLAKKAEQWAKEHEKAVAEGGEAKPLTQAELGAELRRAWDVNPPQDCAACHR